MKKLILCVITFCIAIQVKAKDITGSWTGVITPPGLHLVFNIVKTADSYTATFDSPDQKVTGIPCSKTTLLKDSVHIEIAAINGGYDGLWDGKDGITGVYHQNGIKMPLSFERVVPVEKYQTPKPPFPYISEDVEYDNADKSVHYGATFTKPKGDGKFPAVIIISGSGSQDRDGTLFGHKLYWVLADYLTKQGIAVLRVDDRGVGKSTIGNKPENITTRDFSYDVEASLNYLETRPDVNKKHLGLIGHSEGGLIAPMVAARRKDVNFIVLWGCPAAGGGIAITGQATAALRRSGVDSLTAAAFERLQLQVYALFKTADNVAALDSQIQTVFDAWKKDQPKKTLEVLNVKDNSINNQDIIKAFNDLYNIPWWQFILTYDPETDLSKVKCAVLAVNGAKDTQVNPDINLGRIKEILTKSGNKDFEVKKLPNLNHLLQDCKTGDDAEYEKIAETMSPDAMNIICSWIKLHTK